MKAGERCFAKNKIERTWSEPIPFFTEMGSINPVFVTPGVLKDRGPGIAEAYAGSINLGTGQFCTNPGLISGLCSEEIDASILDLGKATAKMIPTTMLNAQSSRVIQHPIKMLQDSLGLVSKGNHLWKSTMTNYRHAPR